MVIFFKFQVNAYIIVRIDCKIFEFEIIDTNWPCRWDLELFWFALDRIHIGWRPWSATEWPGTWFFPRGIAILAIFAFAFDISLETTFSEPVIFHSEFIWRIAAEKLSYWEIFSKDWLEWDISLVDASEFLGHIRASDTWRKSWVSPCIVILAFNSPSTLWSPSNRANSSTVSTRACYILTTDW